MIKNIAKTFALSALFCAMSMAANAQVAGTGWKAASPSFNVQIQGCGKVSGLTFQLTCNAPHSAGFQRAERRYANMTASLNQFEGTVKVTSLQGDKINIKQVFQDGTGPWMIMTVKKPGIVYETEGGQTLASIPIGTSFRVNTVTDTKGKKTDVYINGSKVETKSSGKTPFYDKFGAYAALSGYGPVTVVWSNIKFWTK
jgi:hypothetical protein